MKKQPFLFFALITGIISMIFSGCMKKQNFSDTPLISFTGMELLVDTAGVVRTGILTISYQDGNGDIGLSAADTFPPYQKGGQYYYNYVITYFEKQNGVFQQVDLTIPFSLRIPVLTPNDPNKPIQGYITDSISLYPPPLHDTIKFEAYIYDRALNKSNTITTPEIVLRRR
jgi:hypothetical protein